MRAIKLQWILRSFILQTDARGIQEVQSVLWICFEIHNHPLNHDALECNAIYSVNNILAKLPNFLGDNFTAKRNRSRVRFWTIKGSCSLERVVACVKQWPKIDFLRVDADLRWPNNLDNLVIVAVGINKCLQYAWFILKTVTTLWSIISYWLLGFSWRILCLCRIF